MVILINFNKQPFKVQYRDGSKALIKAIPSNKFVAMKGLRTSEQIKNRVELARHGVTIWDYERGTYYYRNPGTPTGETLQFAFIGNNVKVAQTISAGYSGTATKSGMTFTADNIRTSTIFGFITSANTAMANNTISAVTIANNTYVSFSGGSTTTTNWYQAVTSGATLPAGVTITGYGSTIASAATTFYLTASTIDTNSPFAYLQAMI